MNLRHNKLRGITGALLGHFCHNVATEAILQSVTDINFGPSTTNTIDSARLDVGASWLVSGSQVRKHFLMSGCLARNLHDTVIGVQEDLTKNQREQ